MGENANEQLSDNKFFHSYVMELVHETVTTLIRDREKIRPIAHSCTSAIIVTSQLRALSCSHCAIVMGVSENALKGHSTQN